MRTLFYLLQLGRAAEKLFAWKGERGSVQLEVVMPGIILLNVQTERPLRQVVNRCVPCLLEVIGLNVPIVQLVGINAELNSRLEIHGRVRDCQVSFRILRVPERLCGRFIPLGIYHALCFFI